MMRPALVAAVVASVVLAGCASRANDAPAPATTASAFGAPPLMDWTPGSWWAYHATIGNDSFDIAIIVHNAGADGFIVGTNVSSGFFGLPWNGNVTSSLNPRIGPDEWKLYDFPLSEGKSWAYKLLSYDAKSTAHAAPVDVPGLGPRPGYHLESTAYGRTFARYDYSADVGWFTRLTLVEPTDGHVVLDAKLTSYGRDWQAAYYIEQTIRSIRVDYPTAPGEVPIAIPDGFMQVHATLTAATTAGMIDARLLDSNGRPLATARAVGQDAATDRASARTHGAATWTLSHAGAGLGYVYVELTGLTARGGTAPPPTSVQAADIDLAGLLHSARPAYPQDGQTTSTGLPVGV